MSDKFQLQFDQNLRKAVYSTLKSISLASCLRLFFVSIQRAVTEGAIARNSFASSFQGLCKLILTVVLAPFFQHVLTYQLRYKLTGSQVETMKCF